ncbi:MAG: hypothetical protein REI94_08750 [Moraxellaceae bacterium]|nr:hypothetical protein [Moraxellaceae bacterium]
MGAPDRSIRHLRLRAPDEASVRQAALQLEDALRCASLPDEGGRLLLVRKLALGRFDGELSAQALAQRIEEQVRNMGLQWLHGGEPAAPTAQAVWFRDRQEALQILALRLAARQNTRAWFWPLILPGLRSSSTSAALHAVLASMAADDAAPAMLPATIAGLLGAGHARLLLALISPADARALLRAAGLDEARLPAPPASSASSPTPAPQEPVLHFLPPTTMRGHASVILPRHSAAAWLHTMLLTAGWRIAAVAATGGHVTTEIPDTAEQPPATEALRTAYRVMNTAGTTATSLHKRKRVTRPPETAPIRHTADTETLAPTKETADGRPVAHQASPRPLQAAPAASRRQQAVFDETLPSTAGGLLFLLPVLARLGYADWQAENDREGNQQVAARCLRQLLVRLQLTQDDPAHALLDSLLHAATSTPRNYSSPRSWSDPRIALAWPATALDAEQAASLWLAACRRYLRRVAGIGPASLALRPAGLSWTRTHIDMHFRLADSDLRVRRAGLDIDPGWLPWLGRVVGIHFNTTDWSQA